MTVCAPSALALALALLATAARAAPQVSTAVYGVSPSLGSVHVYTLANDRGMSVKVLDLGGVITEVNAPDRKGRTRNVVLGLGDLKAYGATSVLNALVGRYANRLKNGFTLDGRHYDLTANPAGVTLHGGRAPFGARLWEAKTGAGPDGATLTLSLTSPDADQGLPGELKIQVAYTLTNRNELRLDYTATTDKPTVLALTNHVYFNLAGNGSGTVYGQVLQVLADRYTPVDADLVPTGETTAVAGTPFDFRTPHAIGERIRSADPQMLIGHGYDHNFVLRNGGGALALAARLHDPESGRVLELSTTEPGLQVYSGNLLAGVLVSAAGTTLRQGDGLALETQHFPNSPNIPAFPSTVLRPGETFRSTTVFHFSTDRDTAGR